MLPSNCLRDSFLSLLPGLISTDCKVRRTTHSAIKMIKSCLLGLSLTVDSSRLDQTTLTRFLSGHVRTSKYCEASKHFETCSKGFSEEASPEHLLTCLNLYKQDINDNPMLVLDF
ncbi:hypothetical protein NPIL_433251 [Nephila pilipes]|uniref:Uncharacterized protein n=1 Tax=Nephila pilipes TaxID=299642 RepID=A0A8X6TN96_NEPPI|nr:hypothetical protein NPIL_433251 [Nephila pilipes]